jgi:hypothetical protein
VFIRNTSLPEVTGTRRLNMEGCITLPFRTATAAVGIYLETEPDTPPS